jgi:uncharacterized protein (TIGR01777 family)
MKILISGSTGMIGSALLATLQGQGHEVARLVRPDTQARLRNSPATGGQRDVLWDPVAGQLDASADGADAVVHLAGASIADGRWTPARKRILQESRVAATRHLVSALFKLRHPPQIFVASSAIGFYGDRGDEELAEDSAPGNEFLAQLCLDWETESLRAKEFGARVVTPRFGIVLAKNGGALPRMLLPFKLGAGGRIGSGKQWMSWIALRDIVGILIYALGTSQLSGPANAVSPHPVRNAEFTKDLGHVLHRPTLFPAPGFALRLALGEMADALLLSSQRVLPKKLEQLGYEFQYSHLESALEAILR